jgi:alanyl-tRNA synthetase
LKKLVYELKNEVSNACIVLAATIEDKPQVAVFIDEALLANSGFHAGNIVRELAKEIQGGGGGQPFFATAGGKDLAGLPQVVAKAKIILL